MRLGTDYRTVYFHFPERPKSKKKIDLDTWRRDAETAAERGLHAALQPILHRSSHGPTDGGRGRKKSKLKTV